MAILLLSWAWRRRALIPPSAVTGPRSSSPSAWSRSQCRGWHRATISIAISPLAHPDRASQTGHYQASAESNLGPLWHSLRAYELTLYRARSEHFEREFLDNSHLKVLDDSPASHRTAIELKTPLIILMSMSVLLVVLCAINVATLLLLRAAARAREMSMRYALGAKRGRIVSQLLVEGGMLGLAGAAPGWHWFLWLPQPWFGS